MTGPVWNGEKPWAAPAHFQVTTEFVHRQNPLPGLPAMLMMCVHRMDFGKAIADFKGDLVLFFG